MAKRPRKKTGILIAVIVLSIVLYLSGVLSGLYANKILKKETEEDLNFLINYIDILESNLESVQLEATFAETLGKEEQCAFSSIAMGNLMDSLRFYWDRLPFRIEEYEKGRQLSDEYLDLKAEYTKLSIRAWIKAKSIYDNCKTDFMPVLYLYSADCDICVEQGRQLDSFKKKTEDMEIMVFTVDIDSGERMLGVLKQYYNITETPAIILDNQVFQGAIFDSEDLMVYVR